MWACGVDNGEPQKVLEQESGLTWNVIYKGQSDNSVEDDRRIRNWAGDGSSQSWQGIWGEAATKRVEGAGTRVQAAIGIFLSFYKFLIHAKEHL